MVTQFPSGKQRGALITEWVVAMGILAVVMLPLAFSFNQESKLCRAAYFKAAALEIIDGEMEVLAAGEWRAYKPGPQEYSVSARAATNLPPGAFRLTLADGQARLEWIPKSRGHGATVAREVKLK